MINRGILFLTMLLANSLAPGAPQGESGGKTHVLKATPETVAWGYYDGSVSPVLTVDSGRHRRCRDDDHRSGPPSAGERSRRAHPAGHEGDG